MNELINHFFISALPASVCFTFACICLVQHIHHKTTITNAVLTALMVIGTIFFFTESKMLIPKEIDFGRSYIVDDILCKFSGLALLPLASIFIYRRCAKEKARINVMTYCLFIPCIAIGFGTFIIYAIGGVDEMLPYIAALDQNNDLFPAGFDAPIFHAHYLLCVYVYNAVLLLMLVSVLIYMVLNMRKRVSTIFFFLLAALGIVRVLLGRSYLASHIHLSNLLSLIIALCILHIAIRQLVSGIHYQLKLAHSEGYEKGIAEANQSVETAELQVEAQLYDTKEDNEDENEEVVEDDKKDEEVVPNFEGDATSALTHELGVKIHHYIIEQQAYLDPELTIDMVATKLNTNRTYISMTINNVLGMNFKEYLNTQRIKHAKQLLKEQPNCPLGDIAAQSGFASTPQFIRKFKEMEGTTPGRWKG